MDFLILRPLPPKTGYHFFGGWGGGGVGGGGQKFLLHRLQPVGTHSAVNTVSGPVVTQLIPDLQASDRILVCRILAPPSAAAQKWPNWGPNRRPAGSGRLLYHSARLGLQCRASLLLGSASATDKKPKLCVSD